MRAGYIDFSNQEYIDNEAFESWMTRGIPQFGDILFTTEAPLGMACKYPKDGVFGVGQRTVTLRVNEKLNSDFLLYFLLSEKGQLLIDLRSSGSTAKGIKSSELKKIKVYFPVIVEEQQKIASALTAVDKEIKLLEVKLTHFKQEKKALMQQLLTGKRRVKVDDKEVS
ncbi:restriction endonuclease subunit S [Celerinatantimonas yamalensis]|uniref:Restriction endonuclease subunit S n=1 Tax=Celerinatantimonas yamalensis TaxID=559956 RepID=A0ABW9GCN1_9GAMM